MYHLRWKVVRSFFFGLCFRACVRKNASNSEITQFHEAICSAENVLTFEVAMQNFLIVTVLHSEANLRELVKKLVLTEVVF